MSGTGHMCHVLPVIRASGLRSSMATSLRFVENGHLDGVNFGCATDDLLHPIASKHGAGKWREPGHIANVLQVIRASGLRSFKATSLRFAENGHLAVANFRCSHR